MKQHIQFSLSQIFGGAGFNTEYPVEKLMRDAKIFQVSFFTFAFSPFAFGAEIFTSVNL